MTKEAGDGGGDDGAAAAAAAAAAAGDGGGDKGGKPSLAQHIKDKSEGGGDKGGLPPKPDGAFDLALLPEDMRGATPDETLGKLFPKFKEFSDKEAARGAVPTRQEDYPIELDADTAKLFPDLANDPAMEIARKWALENKMPANEFKGTIGGLLTALAKGGVMGDAIDPDAEMTALGGGEKAEGRVTAAENFITRLETTDKAPASVINEAKLMMATASGVEMLEWIQARSGEQGIDPPGDGGRKGALTAADIKDMRKDERYRTDSDKYDPAFRKRTDDLAKTLIGK